MNKKHVCYKKKLQYVELDNEYTHTSIHHHQLVNRLIASTAFTRFVIIGPLKDKAHLYR